MEKIADPSNTKEYYQPYLKKKHKIGKTIKINFQQPQTLEKPNIVDIKSAIIEYPKTFHKLSKAIMHAEKISQVSGASKNSSKSPSYNETKKYKIFGSKNAKITKRSHAYKGYVSTHNVEILNSFNSELQLKDTESSIKNKPIYLSSELRGFKFVTTLVLEFKEIQNDDETKHSIFYSNSKAETIINENCIVDIFQVGLLIQSYIILLIL